MIYKYYKHCNINNSIVILPQSVWQLELIGCNEITEAGLWACLTPRIVSLTLSDCINVADDAVGAVAQMLPALNEFTLQAYHVTDAALGFFSSRQSNSLSALRLQSCWELTNHGIVNIGELRTAIHIRLVVSYARHDHRTQESKISMATTECRNQILTVTWF